MKIESEIAIDIIQSKDIYINIPYSNKVDSRTFSRLLDDDKVVASYKMYWLLGILEEASAGNTEIDFKRIIARMITYAWYPHMQYKLSFGVFDNLKKPIKYVSEKYSFPASCDERTLLEFLYSSEDIELQRIMKDLTLQVPYRLLSPFFSESLRKVKDSSKNKIITEMSLTNEVCLYKIVKGKEDKIIINDGWEEYMKENYKLIKAWIYYKLVCFLQKRNPNIPAIAFKLEAPKTRNLNKATKIWNKIIDNRGIRDIYTGKEFNNDNYTQHGVLSIDHFIPWSFVLHDEMWNLVPTFKNINSAKNDNLLDFDSFIEGFCDIQYTAFSYICENKLKDALEDYMDILRIDSPYDFYRNSTSTNFNTKLRQCISPLYQIAVNQGFEVVRKFV
jgi:hypothetical protein